MRQPFTVTMRKIFIVIVFNKFWITAHSVPTQVETKEALKKVGDFLKDETGSKWLANLAFSGALTTSGLIEKIINSTNIDRNVIEAAETIKLSLKEYEKTNVIDDLFNLEDEGWKELIKNVEEHDDIICLYRKHSNVSDQRSEDWQSFLKSVSSGYTVHLALDMGKKYVLCMKKIPESNSTVSSIVTSSNNSSTTVVEVLPVNARKSLTELSSQVTSTEKTIVSSEKATVSTVASFVNPAIGKNSSYKSKECDSSEASCSDKSQSSFEMSNEIVNAGRRKTITKKLEQNDNSEVKDIQVQKPPYCNRPIIYILANYASSYRDLGCSCISDCNQMTPFSVPINPQTIVLPNYRNKFTNNIRMNDQLKIKPEMISSTFKLPITTSNCQKNNCFENKIKKRLDIFKHPLIRPSAIYPILRQKEFLSQPITRKLSFHRPPVKQYNVEKKKRNNVRSMNQNSIWNKIVPENIREAPSINSHGFYRQNNLPKYQNLFRKAPIILPKTFGTNFLKMPLQPITKKNKKTYNELDESEDSASFSSEENLSRMEVREKCMSCPDPCDRPLNLKVIVDSPYKDGPPINMKFFTDPDQKVKVSQDYRISKNNNLSRIAGRRSVGAVGKSNKISREQETNDNKLGEKKEKTDGKPDEQKILENHYEDFKDAVNSFYD
ncbi:hypothetical protein HCN44_010909 [Aphidius gifuensis]|uniref:Odorant-binding protein n=1 Tax=Aphidius gifuensis TaxID=684658 RepID=A0A834Y4N1_APHGI|nr:uncharacterized protein LOC122848916 [Aphidius gifuensis]KAF7998501.1 hypothetical protein HCN44_010909 [Aphidius gifuensis]